MINVDANQGNDVSEQIILAIGAESLNVSIDTMLEVVKGGL